MDKKLYGCNFKGHAKTDVYKKWHFAVSLSSRLVVSFDLFLCSFMHFSEYISELLPYHSPPTLSSHTRILSAQANLLCSNTMFLRVSHSHF